MPDERIRQRVHQLVARHGWSSTSFQVLEEGFDYWFAGDDACVAYSRADGAWIAAGPPLAAPDAQATVARAFVAAAGGQRRRAAFFAVEQAFVDATGLAATLIGEQPSWEPEAWGETVRGHRSLRGQLQRAVAHGVFCRRASSSELGEDMPLRRQIGRLMARWRAAQPMAPMGFVVHLELFSHLEERRLLVAQTGDGHLLGVLSMVPITARQGWLLEDFLRDPGAPNGTIELLIDAAMRQAWAEGGRYVTLGLAPLAGQVGTWLRRAQQLASGLYDFAGLYAFKAKLRPSAWTPIYLARPADSLAVTAMVDVLRAFAPRGLVRFALDTLLRGPSVVVTSLWLLLVPWTLALACMDTAAWFPAPWVHGTWVAVDVALIGALAWLNRRWSHGLATALSIVVSLDAAATLAELCFFPAPRGWGAAALKLAAVAAPSLAATVLWRARRHRRRWRR